MHFNSKKNKKNPQNLLYILVITPFTYKSSKPSKLNLSGAKNGSLNRENCSKKNKQSWWSEYFMYFKKKNIFKNNKINKFAHKISALTQSLEY